MATPTSTEILQIILWKATCWFLTCDTSKLPDWGGETRRAVENGAALGLWTADGAVVSLTDMLWEQFNVADTGMAWGAARGILSQVEKSLLTPLPKGASDAPWGTLRAEFGQESFHAAMQMLRTEQLVRFTDAGVVCGVAPMVENARRRAAQSTATPPRPQPEIRHTPAPKPVTPAAPAPVTPPRPAVVSSPAAVAVDETPPKPAAPKPAADPAYSAEVPAVVVPKPEPVPAPAAEVFPFDLNDLAKELRGIRAALELPHVQARTPVTMSPALDCARRVCVVLHALAQSDTDQAGTKAVLYDFLSREQRKHIDAALELLVRDRAVILTGSKLRGGIYTLVNPSVVGWTSWELLDQAAEKVRLRRKVVTR